MIEEFTAYPAKHMINCLSRVSPQRSRPNNIWLSTHFTFFFPAQKNDAIHQQFPNEQFPQSYFESSVAKQLLPFPSCVSFLAYSPVALMALRVSHPTVRLSPALPSWTAAGNNSPCSALRICCELEGHSNQNLQPVQDWFMCCSIKAAEQNRDHRSQLLPRMVQLASNSGVRDSLERQLITGLLVICHKGILQLISSG